MDCELCNIGNPETESQFWIMTTCATCHVPMFVLKRHSDRVSIQELEELLMLLRPFQFTDSLTLEIVEIRTQARKILDHIHFHLVS